MSRTAPARSNHRLSAWVVLSGLLLLVGVTLAMPVRAADDVQVLVVKYRDDAVVAGATGLPHALADKLGGALGTSFSVGGLTRDGAFRITLPAALSIDAVRAALNRVRLDPIVLYAGVAPGAPVPDTIGRPTDRIIVKYRNPALVANARVGVPLDPALVAQLVNASGHVLSWRRGLPDGANVLQLMSRLPIGHVEALTAAIAQLPEVEYAQPDYIRTTQIVPTDPCYASASVPACGGGYQWDLFDPVGGINMPAAWDITTGSASINVAVIDTGALLNHPDLAGRFVGGYDMIADCAVANDGSSTCTWSPLPYNAANPPSPSLNSRDSDASDPGDWVLPAENAPAVSPPPPPYYDWFAGCGASNSSFHGTHVAGTIGANPNNGIGITGINWVSKIVPLRVLGKCGGYTSDIAAAMIWAAGGSVAGVPANANPARVLSLSLGGGGSCDATSQNAINTALGLGAVVVVAAGNSNVNASGSSPASCSGVITVAATIKNGARARYSNYGATIEIAAPGGNADGVDPDILSTLNDGAQSPNPSGYNYVRYAGTSMATPHVSGVASLMLSINPALTPAQVLSKIQSTARVFPTPGPACNNPTPQASSCNCTTALCGSGILDAAAAVASAAGGSLPPTTTTLGTSGSPVTFGTSVTFTATVNGTNPTGAVNFKDGALSITGCSAVALTGAGNSRTAACTTSALTVGTHSVTATYGGDAGNATSTSTALSQVVNAAPAPTSTALSSAPNPANVGVTVTFTATVTGNAPTGTVNFMDGVTSITGCSAAPLVLVGGGIKGGGVPTATCSTSTLPSGTHSVTATYSGNATNAASTSAPVSQVINGAGPAPTTTGLQTSGSPSTFGASVTFTATVNGISPTGTVNFKDGALSIAGCSAVALTGAGNSRTAACATSTLAVGTHSVTAVYGGDAGNTTSTSSTVTQVINGTGLPPTSTSLQTSGSPSAVGVTVTFTATVTGNAPTGTVNFMDGVTSITGCSAAPLVLVGGGIKGGGVPTATCSTSTLPAGTHSVTATYSGNASNAASTSAPVSQVINGAGPASTTTGLQTSGSPSTFGASVTFTATVNGIGPTGTVDFKDGASSIATCSAVAVTGSGNSRTAACTTSVLTVGVHSVTAVYSGDAGNATSTSPPVSQVINASGMTTSATTLATSANPAFPGTSVTFTATVTGISPTGAVAFKDGAGLISGCTSQPLTGAGNVRTAACTTSSLSYGMHSITAAYGGDAANTSSTSPPLQQSIGFK